MYITPYYRNSVSPIFNEIDRIFQNAFEGSAQSVAAALNIFEQDDRYLATIEAPGFSKDAFDIEVEQAVVRVNASAKIGEGEQAYDRELSRAFRLPESVNSANISARYENGVLSLELPKQPTAQPKKIEIQ